MPKPIFDRLNAELLTEKAEVTQELCTARATQPEPVNLQECHATFSAALAAMEDPDAPVKEKNDLLRACIERITYSRPRSTNGRRAAPFTLDVQLRV